MGHGAVGPLQMSTRIAAPDQREGRNCLRRAAGAVRPTRSGVQRCGNVASTVSLGGERVRGDRGYCMSQQPEVTTVSPEPMAPPIMGPIVAGPPQPKAAGSPPVRQQRIPRWLERSELFLRVLVRMYIGLAVCIAPWLPMFWDHNPLFAQFPSLGVYAVHGWVRGLVSGVGILNLWIAFQDAVRHRDG